VREASGPDRQTEEIESKRWPPTFREAFLFPMLLTNVDRDASESLQAPDVGSRRETVRPGADGDFRDDLGQVSPWGERFGRFSLRMDRRRRR